MGENGWLHSFCGSIREHVPSDVAEEILDGYETQDEEKAEALSSWLKSVMERIDKLLDEPKRTEIMKSMGNECAEMNREKHVDPVIAKRMSFASLDEYLGHEESNPQAGYRIERDGQAVYVHYDPSALNTRCYCQVWRGLPEKEDASITWCHCSRGFIERLWEGILGETPRVDLLCSTLSGADECVFAVYL